MKKVIDNIYWIEGLMVGRVYVIEGADGLTLVDASLPNSMKAIAKDLEKSGHSINEVKKILVTHAHPDHIGSLADLQKATGAKVYVHKRDSAVAAGLESTKMADLTALTGLSKVMARAMKGSLFPKTDIFKELVEGDGLDEVMPGLTTVELHGHSLGHSGFYLPAKNFLIGGDVMMHLFGLRLPLKAVTPSMDDANQSIRKVAGMKLDVLCFGHGDPITGDVSATIGEFMDRKGIPH